RELAAQGDPLACELFQDQAFALGMALLTIQYIGDFDCLVIGGGVCDLEDEIKSQYLKTTLSSFHEHALDGFRDFSNIEFSRCGDQASVIGAYFDAMQG
ncbi:MAG: ROK family protein, partial [Planctomycetota bacterium]